MNKRTIEITIETTIPKYPEVNHVDNILEELYQQIRFMKNPLESDNNPYPISINGEYDDDENGIIRGLFKQITHPANLSKEELPAIFIGFGQSRNNDNIRKPANYKGETVTIIVSIMVEEGDEGKLSDFITKSHTAMRMLVKGSQNLGNSISQAQAEKLSKDLGYKIYEPSTKEVRLMHVRPYRERRQNQVSRRMLILCNIEVDYIYSVLL